MSLLKKIFAKQEEPARASSSPPLSVPPKQLDPQRVLSCAGIDWNAEAQSHFLTNIIKAHLPEAEEAIGSLGLDSRNADLRVLYAMIVEMKPTRLMEVGCGESTVVIREAMKRRNLPAELIGIDANAEGRAAEAMDAHLDQALHELPISDFRMLRANEMLLVSLDKLAKNERDVHYFFREILPELNSGVVVCLREVALPLAGGMADALLQMYLTNNARLEILFSGRWLQKHHANVLTTAMGTSADAVNSFWFRLR